MSAVEIKKGLEGVVFDSTEISKPIPEAANLLYRGYRVSDLVDNCNFEEVCYLIRFGELPNSTQLKEFTNIERENRVIPKELYKVIECSPRSCHPMDSLRTALSFLGSYDLRYGEDYLLRNEEFAKVLLSQTPTVVAADMRIKQGKEPIAPREDLNFSENFFYMCFGRVPEKEFVKALDASLILYAEHGFNASTFTARVVVSSLSDMFSGIVAAVGSLKGVLHGGANEAVMQMLIEIDAPNKAKDWVIEALSKRKKIMGFGHRLYRKGDSRVPKMKEYRNIIASLSGGEKWVQISNIIEETMLAEKNIFANLDFPAGPCYFMMGFPTSFFTPIFVMSRISGWTAHILEQLADNKLVRPKSHYIGAAERDFVPIETR